MAPSKNHLRSPSAQTPHRKPYVRLYLAGEFVRNFEIPTGTFTVGRDPSCEIRLEGRYISRRHFQIESPSEGRIYVQDLGSSNGTHLNGKKVSRAAVAHGDAIEIGEVRMVFSNPAHAEPKIIPFPQIKTDPRAEAPRARVAAPPEKRPVRTVPLRAPVVWVPSVLAAALVAWVLHRQFAPSVEVPVERIPAVVSETAPEPVPSSSVPQIEKPPEEPVHIAPKIQAAGKKKPQEPSAVEQTGEIGRTLDRSLEELKKTDLAGIEEGVRGDVSGPDSKPRALKSFKGESAAIEVDIQIPKMNEERLKREEKTARDARRAFDPRKYQEMLKSKIPGMDFCYYEHAKDGVTGKISVRFSIAANGSVKASRVEESTIPNAALQDCILKRIAAMKVDPPPYDGFNVTYGFRFAPRQIRF